MEKRLYRSREDSIIGGVCGGMGEYFGTDQVLIRILWVMAVFFIGTGLLAYVICWIVIPLEKAPAAYPQPQGGVGPPQGQQQLTGTCSTPQYQQESENTGVMEDYVEGAEQVPADAVADHSVSDPGKEHAPSQISSQGPPSQKNPDVSGKSSSKDSMSAGIILVVLGVAFLLNEYIPGFNLFKLWPVIIIVIGIMIITGKNRSK